MIRSNKKQTKQYQTYPDGWGTSYGITDRRITETKQEVIHFAESVVGERRFWDAQVLGVRIDKAVLVPYDSKVDADDLFVIDGKQYEVRQKQGYDKTVPRSWLLSLSESVITYRRQNNGGQG